MAFQQRVSDASANWRQPRVVTEMQQQQQFLSQQQNNMYQYQMALQALNQQTMEMQERLIAQMNQTSLQTEFKEEDPEVLRQRRFAALSNLQRAQQNRNSPEPPEPAPLPPSARSNRLSFNGAESILEQAVARRTASQPLEQMYGDFNRGHTRSASSTSSTQSAMLSDTHKRMTSPSTGLTLVLSQPGDSFPSPTLEKSTNLGKRLTLKLDGARAGAGSDSSASSSSPRTPPSENNSEVYSFESVTSLHTDNEGKDLCAPRLNPSAPAFTPVPSAYQAAHGRSVSAASIGRPASPFAKPIRQPKGPCSDEQLASLNFAGRVRSRAFNQMRSKLRATSPVQAFFPI